MITNEFSTGVSANMNVARGYRRLVVAVVGAWISAWAAVGGFAAYQQRIWSRIFIEASKAGRTEELVLASEKSQAWGDLVGRALVWGAFAIPLAIAFGLIWWVYRGFVPGKT
jgi:hypothetical protein